MSEPDYQSMGCAELQPYYTQTWEVFDEKGYQNVYYSPIDFECNVPHLDMYKGQIKRFTRELERLGLTSKVVKYQTNKFRCGVIIYKDDELVNPLSLLEFFRENLTVRGGKL